MHAYASEYIGHITQMVMIEWHMVILKYDTCAQERVAAAVRRSSFV